MSLPVNWAPEHPPGIYFAEVKSAELGNSKKDGSPFIKVVLGNARAGNKKLCDDIIMLDGPGRGMGLQKLKAFGFSKEAPPQECSDLVGKRAHVCIGSREWQGQEQACVNSKMNGSLAGYWPENAPPVMESLAPIDGWKRTDGTEGPADLTPF